jgi:hypothetical protein
MDGEEIPFDQLWEEEIERNLRPWISKRPRTRKAFAYSVEEWALMREAEERRRASD